MPVCPACGQENPDEARFCFACGTPFETEAPERRKLATLLFCDMSGSTALGERVDAESVRELMLRYFEEMRGVIERHGGTVEKFIGDAVMAVFGVPVGHEDDALRAVRAAWEMQERLTSLNDELEQRHGTTIALRIGVNTGEVVAGDATNRQALVTGDAVNVAARLEQAAAPGDVLIGEPTYALVRDAVSAEPVAPLELKGKSEPMPAFRLTHVDVKASARARRLDTPLIGRQRELALLRATLGEAAQGRCVLATVVGEPGVGKSRLVAELLASVEGDFQVLSGSCLEYGEGITYWPIAEIVRQAADIRDEHGREQAVALIETLLPGPDAEVVAQAMGLAVGDAGTDAIADAVARLFESIARERPLLLVVDDLHRGEAALLELVRGLPRRIPDAPVLLLCLSRPELLEDGSWRATVPLEPLAEVEATSLVEHLLGEAELPEGLEERISLAAAGNPLFVEELIGMLIDEGLLQHRSGNWVIEQGLAEFTIPPTLRELLGARLDRIPTEERSALERGAVEGQTFHHGAVVALSRSGERTSLIERLRALEDREFIQPAQAAFADEAAYSVRHILIRDAAYEAIPKKVRADLHERFADWLEGKLGDRVAEYDEILGYHLEQAYRYHEALGPADHELALRASERLAAAGRRAAARRDASAGVSLLLRAADLRPPGDAVRLELLEPAGHLLIDRGDLERAESLFARLLDEALPGNRQAAARAEIYAVWTRFLFDPSRGVAEMLEVADRLQPILDELGDDASLARLLDIRAYVYDIRRQSMEVERETEIALIHARRAGNRPHELELHWWLFWQLPQGPRRVEDAIARAHELRAGLDGDEAADAAFFESLAQLEAMRGRFDEARDAVASSITIRDRLALGILTAKYSLPALGVIELMAGDAAAAETALRRARDDSSRIGDPESASNAAALLAEALLAQDRLAEAEQLLPIGEENVGDAVLPRVRWACVRAKIWSRKDKLTEALSSARDAVQLTVETDDLNLQGAALLTLAAVTGEAAHADEARLRFAQKGNVVSAAAAQNLAGSSSHPQERRGPG